MAPRSARADASGSLASVSARTTTKCRTPGAHQLVDVVGVDPAGDEDRPVAAALAPPTA